MVAKKTSLTDSPCQNASYVIPGRVRCADALSERKQEAGWKASGKDTKEMTDSWQMGASGLMGPAPMA